jgi:hypothetical protein
MSTVLRHDGPPPRRAGFVAARPAAVRLTRRTLAHRAGGEVQHVDRRERLGEKVEGAELHRRHCVLDRAVGRDDDRRHLDARTLRLTQQVESGESRHAKIGDQEIDAARLEPRQALFPGSHPFDREAAPGEHLRQPGPHAGLVVHHQNAPCLRHDSLASSRLSGKCTVKVAP